jgi:hypothetical protein
MTAASELLSRLQGRTLIVVGDLMLDHFLVGAVDRISPEAPVPPTSPTMPQPWARAFKSSVSSATMRREP